MNKKLSKQQIEAAAEELNTGNHLRLNCDGYDITLRIARLKMRLVIVIYINDQLDPKWLTEHEQHPESKFLRSSFKSIYSSAKKTRLIKMYGKRAVKKIVPNLDAKLEFKVHYFTTALSALKHLNKVSNSIAITTTIQDTLWENAS